MDEKKEVEIVPNKELLTNQLNAFNKQLIDNVLDYRRHLQIMSVDPSHQRQNPQTGKFVGIEELVDNYRRAALNAREYVTVINELLKADTDGTLAETWSTLEYVPVNMGAMGAKEKKEDEGDEGKDEGEGGVPVVG